MSDIFGKDLKFQNTQWSNENIWNTIFDISVQYQNNRFTIKDLAAHNTISTFQILVPRFMRTDEDVERFKKIFFDSKLSEEEKAELCEQLAMKDE